MWKFKAYLGCFLNKYMKGHNETKKIAYTNCVSTEGEYGGFDISVWLEDLTLSKGAPMAWPNKTEHFILFSLLVFRFQGSLLLDAESSLKRVKILTFRPTPTNKPEIELSRTVQAQLFLSTHEIN